MSETHCAVRVELAERSYDIDIALGALGRLGPVAAALRPSRVLVVTDRNVGGLYLSSALGSLEASGVSCGPVVVPAGERSKSLARLKTLYDAALGGRFDRQAIVLALGGGVVGDLAGYLAATLLRGVRFLQAPTTLLAMVDSAVGGKVGVNHPAGKNLIGAFHQPSAVVADLDCLATLPPRELRAGLAEVVKYGMILDAGFFEWLERHAHDLLALDAAALAEAVARSCRFKAEVVRQDERETGRRAILNYGHTFGHAFESLTRFRRFRHGEAVAIGMVAAAELAFDLGMIDAETAQRQRTLLHAFGLPVTLRGLAPADVVARFAYDKKALGGRPVLVLPERIGSVRLVPGIDLAVIERSLQRIVEP